MVEHPDLTPGSVDRTRFDLVLADDFTGDSLDRERWIDHYLPHWTTPERSAARYSLDGDGVRLLIEADQPAWRPEDGELRVSNLQTGSFSGPAGSDTGQHRHRPDLRVRTPWPVRRLWAPSAGLVEVRLRASADPTCLTALWLVGLEQASPEQPGEICIAELFGNVVGPERSQVRLGIKAHHDPRLRSEMLDLALEIDATQEHCYGAEWDARGVRFYVDDLLVHQAHQSLDYPLHLMVDLFELPTGGERDVARYPKSAQISSVRGYEPHGQHLGGASGA
jgi:hypothetical protein